MKQMDYLEGLDVVMALGGTGAGKSTMLTSLVFGPHTL